MKYLLSPSVKLKMKYVASLSQDGAGLLLS